MTREAAPLTPGATDLDYAGVARYWRSARTSILGPYMMDGFGFPSGAGQFRFRAGLLRHCVHERVGSRLFRVRRMNPNLPALRRSAFHRLDRRAVDARQRNLAKVHRFGGRPCVDLREGNQEEKREVDEGEEPRGRSSLLHGTL